MIWNLCSVIWQTISLYDTNKQESTSFENNAKKLTLRVRSGKMIYFYKSIPVVLK